MAFKPVIGPGDPNPKPPQRRSILFEAADQAAGQAEASNTAAFKSFLQATPPIINVPFFPFLVVRSQLGDHGERPIGAINFASPLDIWVTDVDPGPSIPPGGGIRSSTLTEGASLAVYAHVWNLGRAPTAGVQVDFFMVDTPNCGQTPSGPMQSMGTAWLNLGPAVSLGCHQLVMCPNRLTVPPPTSPFSIIVQVSALGDPVTVPWQPYADRHIARRDFNLGSTSEMLDQVFDPRTADPAQFSPAGATLCAGLVGHAIQTFTAGITGQLTRVDLYLGNGVGHDLEVSLVNAPGGVPDTSGTLIGNMPNASLPGSSPAFVAMPVNGSLSVQAGLQYGISLGVVPPPLVCYIAETWQGSSGATPPYSGQAFYIDGMGDPNRAMGFRTNVCGINPGMVQQPAELSRKRRHRTRH